MTEALKSILWKIVCYEKKLKWMKRHANSIKLQTAQHISAISLANDRFSYDTE